MKIFKIAKIVFFAVPVIAALGPVTRYLENSGQIEANKKTEIVKNISDTTRKTANQIEDGAGQITDKIFNSESEITYETEYTVNYDSDYLWIELDEENSLNIEDGYREFEYYSDLDELGRCGYAYANISIATMPTDNREEILETKPSGWKQKKYGDTWLYNRCHLIAYCLAGENDNNLNLITGTEYFNKEGMWKYEKMVQDYCYKTKNHVLYKVTPIYEGDKNLIASFVKMEAKSVEDNGEGINFNVLVKNIEPNIVIDYATGESWEEK